MHRKEERPSLSSSSWLALGERSSDAPLTSLGGGGEKAMQVAQGKKKSRPYEKSRKGKIFPTSYQQKIQCFFSYCCGGGADVVREALLKREDAKRGLVGFIAAGKGQGSSSSGRHRDSAFFEGDGRNKRSAQEGPKNPRGGGGSSAHIAERPASIPRGRVVHSIAGSQKVGPGESMRKDIGRFAEERKGGAPHGAEAARHSVKKGKVGDSNALGVIFFRVRKL